MSKHFNRRSAMGNTFGAATALINEAQAGIPSGKDVERRGTVGKLERLPSLDLESNDEFLTSLRIFNNATLFKAADNRAVAIMKERGVDIKADMPVDQAVALFKDDPLLQTRFHLWLNSQRLMWQNISRELHDNYDAYMSEMEAADKAGPGTLELNPGIGPEYTTHEIHMQPGGYSGDPFAGHLYHYGTNNFYSGRNYQDDLHVGMASKIPVPKDGKILRILDAGCSCGQMTVALKQRFPEAEVWGIDVAGPMVRYSHMRAVDLGVEVHFAQRLAEDSKFPDNHFDIVTSYILHHEVTAEASRQIIKESHRILRPGGVYFPIDFNTADGPQTSITQIGPYAKLRNWASHRWNHERWLPEYDSISHGEEMRRVGFKVETGPPSGFGGRGNNVLGTKIA